MAGITDTVFRRVVARCGKPEVMVTEFVSCCGLCSAGRDALLPELDFDDAERPLVAQLFGANPDTFERTAALIADLGFDGIDINMGCPDRNVEKQGGGAALIRTPELAVKIIRATRRGAGPLPVSVKTRLGYDTNTIPEWARTLLAEQPDALTVHVRTRRQRYKPPVHWDAMADVVAAARREGVATRIIGNGDVTGIDQGAALALRYELDGVMVGRAAFGAPWVFHPDPARRSPPVEQRLAIMLEHARMFADHHPDKRQFALMRKHFCAYVGGWPGARRLRGQLMAAETPEDAEAIVHDFLKTAPPELPTP